MGQVWQTRETLVRETGKSVGSENVNGGCLMTAWREGSATGPKLNLSISDQFFVLEAMDESVFVDTLP